MSIDRLYGLPGAEDLRDDPAAVWESQCDGDGTDGPWIIEEWTVHPQGYGLPPAAFVIDNVVEYLAEAEGGWEGADYEAIANHPDVKAGAEALLDAVRRKVTWHMADRMVAEHTVTMVGDEPYMDGEPMYGKRADS